MEERIKQQVCKAKNFADLIYIENIKLIVTQRCSTIMNSDLILVLDDGMLVGKGTHKELLKNCETYKEICLSQLSKSEVEV